MDRNSTTNPAARVDLAQLPTSALTTEGTLKTASSTTFATTQKNYRPVTTTKTTKKQQQDKKFCTPHAHDVLIGRGSSVNSHPGNVQYRIWIEDTKAEYKRVCKQEKKFIAHQVVEQVRSLNPPGRFLQKDTARKAWFEVQDNAVVHEKVSRALREHRTSSTYLPQNTNSMTSHTSNRSSTHSLKLKQIQSVASMPTVASAAVAALTMASSPLPLSALSHHPSCTIIHCYCHEKDDSSADTKRRKTRRKLNGASVRSSGKSDLTKARTCQQQDIDEITMNHILSTTKDLQMYHDAEFCDFASTTGHQLDKFDDEHFANYIMALDYSYNSNMEKQLNDDESFDSSQHQQDSLLVDYAFDEDFSSPAA